MKRYILFQVIILCGLFIVTSVQSQERYNQSRENAFVKPGVASVYTMPENWPRNNDASPSNRAPKGAKSFAIVLGSGDPAPNPYRMGPSFVVVSNGHPYFIDCGEGTWRAMTSACLTNGDRLTRALDINNLKYLFITHLHCDHTVGIPSWILNAYKYGSTSSKEIYGPKGTGDMMKNIVAAWKVDMEDMWYGPSKAGKEGVTVLPTRWTMMGLYSRTEM